MYGVEGYALKLKKRGQLSCLEFRGIYPTFYSRVEIEWMIGVSGTKIRLIGTFEKPAFMQSLRPIFTPITEMKTLCEIICIKLYPPHFGRYRLVM